MKYRKRPANVEPVFEAWQNSDENPFPAWLDDIDMERRAGGVILVQTHTVPALVEPGHWVLYSKETGEVFVCAPHALQVFYERVDDQEPSLMDRILNVLKEIEFNEYDPYHSANRCRSCECLEEHGHAGDCSLHALIQEAEEALKR